MLNKYINENNRIQDMIYSNFEIQELMKCQDNPEYFINAYCKIQTPIKNEQITLRKYQSNFLKTIHQNRLSISCMPRQSGKTTIITLYVLWYAMFEQDRTIVLTGNRLMTALEMMHRIRFAYENLPDFMKEEVEEYRKGGIVFKNGSRIIAKALDDNSFCGLTISLLVCDEMAFTIAKQKPLMEVLHTYKCIGTKMVFISSLNCSFDSFFKIWGNETAWKLWKLWGNTNETIINEYIGYYGFVPFRATWRDNPTLDDAWAEKQIAQMGQQQFDRDYNCRI
jgi:hypothetical protein